MRLVEIMRVLREEPLIMLPSSVASIVELLRQHQELSREAFLAGRDQPVRVCGETVELEHMEVIDGIAYVPINGPMGIGFGNFEKAMGCVDSEDIMEELDQAEEDPAVRGVILRIDSPGGMFAGTPELGNRIAAVQKPIYAYSTGLVCSAAYWAACGADGIFTSQTATIGSIGVYSAFLDSSAALKERGMKVQVFSSGKFKGMGLPGTSLTKDQAQHLQDRINEMAEMFFQHVEGMRPEVSRDDMQGQTFMGDAAATRGLTDGTVSSLAEVVEMITGEDEDDDDEEGEED